MRVSANGMRRTLGASGTGYSGVGTTRSKWRGEILGKPRWTVRVRPPERRRSSRTTGTLRRPVEMVRSGGSPSSWARSRADNARERRPEQRRRDPAQHVVAEPLLLERKAERLRQREHLVIVPAMRPQECPNARSGVVRLAALSPVPKVGH